MRTKELDDVLVLVDALPEAKQRALVKVLAKVVDNHEAFIAEGVSEEEWQRIRWARLRGDMQQLGESWSGLLKSGNKKRHPLTEGMALMPRIESAETATPP